MSLPSQFAPVGSTPWRNYNEQQSTRQRAYHQAMTPLSRYVTTASESESELMCNMIKIMCSASSLIALTCGAIFCANDPDHTNGIGYMAVGGGIACLTVPCLIYSGVNSGINYFKKYRAEQVAEQQQRNHERWARDEKNRQEMQQEINRLQRDLQCTPNSCDRQEIEITIAQLQKNRDNYDRQHQRIAAPTTIV